MIIGMFLHTAYNLVDAIWVSGLGADALSAVGFFFPFFFSVIAIATGVGVGAGSAISRRIGARDKKGADDVAVHTMYLTLVISICITIPFYVFSEPIFRWMGAGHVTPLVVAYSKIVFAGTISLFFANIGLAVLRSEGDAKRAMWALAMGSILNIILDPIFIYALDLGVAGAAWATIISLTATALLIAYWLFIKADSYVDFKFKGFRFRKPVLKEIFKVGLPASVMQLSMSITMLSLNLIIVRVSGTDGIAVYTTGWRVVMMAILPLLGISTAVVTVCGAAFGAGEYEKLRVAYRYSIKLGNFAMIAVAAAIFIFAPQIASVFTRAETARHLHGDIVTFLRIAVLWFPGVVFGMFSSSMFQVIGKGFTALLLTLLRTLGIALSAVLALVFLFGFGLPGVWWGLAIGNLSGSTVAYIWASLHIRGLSKGRRKALDANSLMDTKIEK